MSTDQPAASVAQHSAGAVRGLTGPLACLMPIEKIALPLMEHSLVFTAITPHKARFDLY